MCRKREIRLRILPRLWDYIFFTSTSNEMFSLDFYASMKLLRLFAKSDVGDIYCLAPACTVCMAQLVRAPVSYFRMNILEVCNPEIASSILAADIDVSILRLFAASSNARGLYCTREFPKKNQAAAKIEWTSGYLPRLVLFNQASRPTLMSDQDKSWR